MKKLLISFFAVLSLCAGLSQLAFADEPDTPTPPQQTEEEQGNPTPCDCINMPEGDNL